MLSHVVAGHDMVFARVTRAILLQYLISTWEELEYIGVWEAEMLWNECVGIVACVCVCVVL